MYNCYACGKELVGEDKSTEHIIPNSLGGKLKSGQLLCKDCNDLFGSTIDASLAKQLAPITNLLELDRDRGSPPGIEVLGAKSGAKYILGPGGEPRVVKPEISETQITDDTVEVKFVANSYQQAKEILKGYQRRNPNLTDEVIEGLLENAEVKEEYLDEHVKISGPIGGNEPFKAIAKIAVNYYLDNGGRPEYIDTTIRYIKSEVDNGRVWYYYTDYDIASLPENVITHIIIIKGNKNSKILYGYVSLFNALQFIVLLSDDYVDEDLELTYGFDLVAGVDVPITNNLKFSRTELLEALRERDIPKITKGYEFKYNKLIKKIMEISTYREISNIVSSGIDKVFGVKDEGAVITDKDINELSKLVGEKFTKFMSRGGRGGD